MAEPARAAGPAAAPMLAVRDLHGWYGESHVLHGIAFDVREGEVVTLLGRNGAGKTTTLKAIMGILGRRKGSVEAERARADRPAGARHRPRRHRLLPGGARHLRQPLGRART